MSTNAFNSPRRCDLPGATQQDHATKLLEAGKRLGRVEGLIEQDAAMRWPYRAQGAIFGGLFVGVCFIGAGWLL